MKIKVISQIELLFRYSEFILNISANWKSMYNVWNKVVKEYEEPTDFVDHMVQMVLSAIEITWHPL